MTPQSSFTILAAVDPRREAELRRLLASMNEAPGSVNPHNALIPFARFEALHFARLVILDDKTVEDVTAYGMAPRDYPLYLAFLGDVDGDEHMFLRELAMRAEGGLRAIFACCRGFGQNMDLLQWMRAHRQPLAALYGNWRGRTVRRIREEAALYDAIERNVRDNRVAFEGLSARDAHAAVRKFVSTELAGGRLTLSPEEPAPLGWRVRNFIHLVGVPLLLLVTLPFLVLVSAIFLVSLRRLEKTDPEICLRVEASHDGELAALEDRDVTNQFSAMGSIKPGFVRRWTAVFVLWIIDYTARHVYTHGRLARVRTIHFARWMFLDGKQRMLFASNYDGSLESYMDDFINKVGFGLNVVFSNGIGYPRTNWLLFGGAKDERKFKDYLRRHQIPTQVWYNAHPGLRTVDLERQTRVRMGVEAPSLSERQARAWVALL